MRKQAFRMALLGVTTLTALQAIALANSTPAGPDTSTAADKGPSPSSPKASSSVTPTGATVAAPATPAVVPDTSTASPTFSRAATSGASLSRPAATPAARPTTAPTTTQSQSHSPVAPRPETASSLSAPTQAAPSASDTSLEAGNEPSPSAVQPDNEPDSPAQSPARAAVPSIPTNAAITSSEAAGRAAAQRLTPSAPDGLSTDSPTADAVSGTAAIPSETSSDTSDSAAGDADVIPELAVESVPPTGGAALLSSIAKVSDQPALSVSTSVLATDATIGHESQASSLRYRLQPGDTLQTIASALEVPVTALAEANGIEETTLLIAGDNLVIPHEPSASPLRYRLQPGDTLQTIALALEMPVTALTEANGIEETTLLIAGEDLVIPHGILDQTEAGIPIKADFEAATLLIAGEDLVIPDEIPDETGAGIPLKADFATAAAAVATPEIESASEVASSNEAEASGDTEFSNPATTRLSYLQATVGRPVDREHLLQQLRPDSQPTEAVSAAAGESAADTVSGDTLESPAESETDIADTDVSDVYASRPLASLRATATVVESDVEADAVPEVDPETTLATGGIAIPVVGPAAESVEIAAVPTEHSGIIAPRPRTTAPGRRVTPNQTVRPGQDSVLPRSTDPVDGFIWPTRGVISSGYGWRWGRMHRGVDIAAPTGTPIVASAPGVVERAGWNNGGYGNLVDIRHSDGSLTRYAHNSRLHVEVGQQVEQGELIAEMGSTGYSTGPHLHFEIHQPTEGTVNPMAFMPDQRLLQAYQ